MSPDEARALLGVEPGLDPKALRRAYLRKVKTCKPEVDPEGFARLRQAYELLLQQPEPDDEPGDTAPEGPIPEAPPEPPPGSEQSWEALEPEDQAFVQRLCWRFGAYLGPEQRAILFQPPDPHGYLLVAGHLRLRDRPLGALPLALRALRLARSGGAAPAVVLFECLELLLTLQARDLTGEARQLFDALGAWMEASGGQASLLKEGRALRWAVARELLAISGWGARHLRTAIASAVLEDDWEPVWDELWFLECHRKGTARRLRRDLPAQAPQLHSLIQDWYAWWDAQQLPFWLALRREALQAAPWLILAVLGFFGVVAVVIFVERCQGVAG